MAVTSYIISDILMSSFEKKNKIKNLDLLALRILKNKQDFCEDKGRTVING